MRRYHLFEFEDLSWFPRLWRDTLTNFLRDTIVLGMDTYAAAPPLVHKLLAKQGYNRVIDLCSGGSGPWRKLKPRLDALSAHGEPVEVVLTDLFPNIEAMTAARDRIDGVEARTVPVDARHVPHDLPGARTLFTSFHHQRPADAAAILEDAFRSRAAIGVFEFSSRRVSEAAMVGVVTPLLVWATVPMQRPFNLLRLLFTYVIPILPLTIGWDAVASSLRTYTTDDLTAMVAHMSAPDYTWEISQVTERRGPPLTYLLGYPTPTTLP